MSESDKLELGNSQSKHSNGDNQATNHKDNELTNSDDQVELSIGDKASNLKEHDVIQEEISQAEKIETEIQDELAENDGWMKILGNDQLMKKVIKGGEPNQRPTRGDICTVKLEGRLLIDNSIFETHDQFTFQLGDSEVIGGLDFTIPLMCKGEVASVQVKSRFGYGEKGLEPLVPANSDLEYTVELLNFETEKDLIELSVAERRDIGNRKRERGNWWYGRGEATLAVQCYRRALEFLDEVEGGISYKTDEKSISEEMRLLIDDRLKTYNNMAAAQLKLQAYEPALKSVEAVLLCQPKNVKALFRKGKILGEKGELEMALAVLTLAQQLEPDNKALTQEITRLRLKRKDEVKSEKLLYKRMFNNKDTNTKSPESRSFLKMSFIVGGAIIAVATAMAYRFAT
jgi:FK506-binding protein 8